MKKLRAIVRIVLRPFRRRLNASRDIDETGDALKLNASSDTQRGTAVGSIDIPGASNAIDSDPGLAGYMDVSHNDVDKAGDSLNLDSPSGTVGGDNDILRPSNAVDSDPGDAGRTDISYNNIDKAGDALNPDSPSSTQPDTDGGDKDMPRASNATEYDSGGSAKPNNSSDTAESPATWLKENMGLTMLIAEAIESLAKPQPGVELRKYLSYGDVSKILLQGLELLAHVHPAAQAVCTSFEAVVALGTMYQKNNHKVAIVRLRMQELLIAMMQLGEIAPGDKKVDIMNKIMMNIAHDIKQAASACDLYASKGLICRIIKSLQYEDFFAEQIARLVDDHKKLMAQLNIEITRNVASLSDDIKELKEIMTKQLKLFNTPREQDLQKFLGDHGGIKVCIKDVDVLQEFLQKSGEGIKGVLGNQSGLNESWSEATMKEVQKVLREEMAENVEEAFEKNFERFKKTLELQGQKLTEIQKVNERIFDLLDRGAHDYIIDTDFKELWKDMHFKKIVEARHLVPVLYEHLSEKFRDSKRASNDRWMLAYLNNAHLQPLHETVDDDATGYITIREINVFVESKPEDWTTLQWITYWAAGWQYSVIQYRRSIYMVISAMHRIYPEVLPANRGAFIRYLRDDIIFKIDKLLQSTHSPPSDAYESRELRTLTKEFIEAEEKRLTDKLKQVQYVIYTPYIVSLVTGQGRIERYIYPMLYLLLMRHLGVLSLSTKVTLDPDELPDMTISLHSIFSIVDERLEILESNFKQSNVDVGEKLNNFAFGMFKLYYENPEPDLSRNNIAKYIHEDSVFDEDLEPPEVSPDDLLYKPLNRAPPCFPHSSLDDDSRNPIQEQWVGQMYNKDGSRFGLMQLGMEPYPGSILTGTARTWQHTMKISGEIGWDKWVRMRLDFLDSDGYPDREELTGRLDAEMGVINGCWDNSDGDEGSEEEGEGDSEENSHQHTPKDAEENKDKAHKNDIVAASAGDADEEAGQDTFIIIDNSTTSPESPSNLVDAGQQVSDEGSTFVFCRTPAPLWRFLPSRPVTVESLARARWKFALKCVSDQAMRENSPGKYFVERFVEAGRFLVLARRELYHAEGYCPRLNDLSEEEGKELEWLKCALRPEFSGPYYTCPTDAIDCQKYIDCTCDSCNGTIVGSRWACLTCMNDSFRDTIDLCAACIEKRVKRRDFVHDASHVLLKCDTPILAAHWQWIIPRARLMVVKIKKEFRDRSRRHTELAQSPSSPQCETCQNEVSLPCWVRVTDSAFDETYLCGSCEPKSKRPTNDSSEFGIPLLRIDDDDDDDDDEAPVEAVITEFRLAALEKKVNVIAELLEKLTSNLPPTNGGANLGGGF